ncbi:MAG: right-handed parallel beta-helix repeat-containing protein, partial [Anaerolineales bacterium]|nr:right-handed parallel beta-helix repeat-containing protein [Anaerolineales bacterium]
TTLTNVTFSGNHADHGGGMINFGSSPTLTNVTFNGNTAKYVGGGMANRYSSSPKLINVTFSGNTADHGGGMYNETSSPTLFNITFSGNTADNGGGMFNYSYSRPVLTNVILWGDTATNGPEIYNGSDSTSMIAYSDIQGCGVSGSWNRACGKNQGNNIDADPLFVNSANGDLHLRITSPAIDAGTNEAVPSEVTTDLEGITRFVDILTVTDTGNGTPPIVDMGAYETLDVNTPRITSTPLPTKIPPTPTITPTPASTPLPTDIPTTPTKKPTATPKSVPTWNFDQEGNFEGWGTEDWQSVDLDSLEVKNGYLTAKATGLDPQIYSDSTLGIDTIKYTHIEIRMRVSVGEFAQIFFVSSNGDWSQDKSKIFTVESGEKFKTYNIDMQDVSSWQGIVNQLRLDPTSDAIGANIDIDYIRLLP